MNPFKTLATIRLVIVFACAAVFVWFFVSPAAAFGVVIGLVVFFVSAQQEMWHRWHISDHHWWSRWVFLLGVIVFVAAFWLGTNAVADFIGGNPGDGIVWAFAAYLLAIGARWAIEPIELGSEHCPDHPSPPSPPRSGD